MTISNQKKIKEVGRFLIATLLYALTYELALYFTASNWVMTGGLRLACLLLLPYRYWPALLLGEEIPLLWLADHCYAEFGMAWSLWVLVPPVSLVMPAIWLIRERFSPFQSAHQLRMSSLMGCILFCTLIWTANGLFTYELLRFAPAHLDLLPPTQFGLRLFLGIFLGILTIVPVAIVLKTDKEAIWHALISRQWMSNRLLLETLVLSISVLAALAWIAWHTTHDNNRQLARILMFLPVAWLAFRHGWRGAALGGALASVAVMLTMRIKHEPGLMQAEAVIAFVITALLLLGSGASMLHRQERRRRAEAQRLHSKDAQYAELRLSQAMASMVATNESMRSAQGQLLSRVQYMLAAVDDRLHAERQQRVMGHMHALVDDLYPPGADPAHLSIALTLGSFAQCMETLGVTYRHRFNTLQMDAFAPATQQAVQQWCGDALCHLFTRQRPGALRVGVRCLGRGARKRWMAVRWVAIHHRDQLSLRMDERDMLHYRLGANTMTLDVLLREAEALGGKARLHTSRLGWRLVLLIPNAGLRVVS
ncbi:MASE1 domain-containing protein [Burkholderia gladioli]|uniref:MASE1 domain-containing protein n=1 Tax=Burkholderia gladioli TaxID=28095 RepID=UPI00163FB1AF|nr:MASE1 domain-containing protein [Burkholderia gladioli]